MRVTALGQIADCNSCAVLDTSVYTFLLHDNQIWYNVKGVDKIGDNIF